MRLITGAVLPVFNHPLKLAGEIGMLDAISGGRLEVGFARAFLPHEFQRFGVSLDESRDRFDEGIAIVDRLLARGGRRVRGAVPPLPRDDVAPPPHPAARGRRSGSPRSRPRLRSSTRARTATGSWRSRSPAAKLASLLSAYRDAWRGAGHPGDGRVMLAFHMLCHEDEATAHDLARDLINQYLASLVDGASGWLDGSSSDDYPGYEAIIRGLKADSFERQLEQGARVGRLPDSISEQIAAYADAVGGFEIASMQVNFAGLPYDVATRSLDLFGREVLPRFSALAATTRVKLALFDDWRVGVDRHRRAVDHRRHRRAVPGAGDADPLGAAGGCASAATSMDLRPRSGECRASAATLVPLGRRSPTPPVLNPGKVVATASNYGNHVAEMREVVLERVAGHVEPGCSTSTCS